MKIKWGALVTDGRNKIGGHVASKNRAGAYLRTKVTPVNPNTSFQAAVRATFTTFSQGWRALSASEIDAWNGAVANFQRTDIFGDLKTPTGKNLYQRLNTNLTTIGETAITVPPLPTGTGEVPTGTLVVNGGTGAVTYALGSAAVPAGTSMVIAMTTGLSPGRNFIKNQFRILHISAAAATGTITLTTEYAARFGAPVTGLRYGLSAYLINTSTGENSTPKISKADAG